MKVCLLIPTYNHGKTMDALLTKLSAFNLSCIIIDDGSNVETKTLLANAQNKFDWIHPLVTLEQNHGKGAAIIAGMQKAQSLGYTHVIQIDADGQHDVNDIPTFLSLNTKHPDALISGTPRYDASVPKSRKHGRKITNFWVCIETLTLQSRDAMCGYRLYPIAPTLAITKRYNIGKRMDFDTEIMVRLIWQGTPVFMIPTKVTYPKDGLSNFRMWRDNYQISCTHTRLIFGMLIRIPKIIKQKCQQKQTLKQEPHWSKIKELGSLLGLKLMLMLYKILGKRLMYFLLYLPVTYFYLTATRAREASQEYLAKIDKTQDQSSFNHFLTFAQSMVDKLDVWSGNVSVDHVDFPNLELLQNNVEQQTGGVILTAHLGNIDVVRALSQQYPHIKFNALVFNRHAVNFNSVLKKVNPNFSLNLIETQSLDITKAVELKEKVDAGEFVVIVGDRTSTSKAQRCLTATFLNQNAALPEGPFVLSGLLQCPVYFMLCLKQSPSRYHLVFEKMAEQLIIKRPARQENLEKYAQQYANLLSIYCEKYPLQWFNFFNFWQQPS